MYLFPTQFLCVLLSKLILGGIVNYKLLLAIIQANKRKMYKYRKNNKHVRTNSTDSNNSKRPLNPIDENASIKIPVGERKRVNCEI